MLLNFLSQIWGQMYTADHHSSHKLYTLGIKGNVFILHNFFLTGFTLVCTCTPTSTHTHRLAFIAQIKQNFQIINFQSSVDSCGWLDLAVGMKRTKPSSTTQYMSQKGQSKYKTGPVATINQESISSPETIFWSLNPNLCILACQHTLVCGRSFVTAAPCV